MSERREVCFLIGDAGVVLWSDASDDPTRLPDSRARWDAIWTRRGVLVEIAHSHPNGPAAFSNEDETTMAALVDALAQPIRFSVVAPDAMVVRSAGPDGSGDEVLVPAADEPWWADLLRLASGMRSRR